jgi:hypothetical protein
MKPRRPRPEKKVGQRNPRIHSWKGTPGPLAELKKVKVVHHRNPRRV